MTKRARGLVTCFVTLNAWTIAIARRNPRRASRKCGCARGDTAQRERKDIFANVFARQFRRAPTRLQLPNCLPAVRLPGDGRYSPLKNGATHRVNDATAESRDPVARANCGL